MESAFFSSIAEVIQLAVAPVFLLTGIGAFLSVLTNRLGRIVDRARVLRDGNRVLDHREKQELPLLIDRVKLINASISFGTFSAFLVCLVIVTLFVFHFMAIDSPVLIAGFFIGAMVCLIISLLLFQREVYLAIRTVRIFQSD